MGKYGATRNLPPEPACWLDGSAVKALRFALRAAWPLALLAVLPALAQNQPTDFTPSLADGILTVAPGRMRFGAFVCPEMKAPATLSSTGNGNAIGKLYISDSCALVLEYPNTLQITFKSSGITAAAVSAPGTPAAALLIAEVQIAAGALDSVVDKRSIYSAFSAMAGPGIVIDCTNGPCLFSTDPAVVMTSGGANAVTGTQDNRNAAQTFPAKLASSEPSTCSAGEQYFDTTNSILKICVASNTWVPTGSQGASLLRKIDSQSGMDTALSDPTGSPVATSLVPPLHAGQCLLWTWTGWASDPGVSATITYGGASLAVLSAFDSGNGAELRGRICNNNGVQNVQTLSASSYGREPMRTGKGSVDTTAPQNLTLTMTGTATVTTQLWTAALVN